MFKVEVVLENNVISMLFSKRAQAENARRKIAKEMAKGRYRNNDDVIEIKSDASTYSIAPSRVQSISVNDCDKWLHHQAEQVALARALGVPVYGDGANG